MLNQQKRPLGQTNIALTALGFGAAPIGNLYRAVTDNVAYSAVKAALDAGINYFDSAPLYGFGLSERRVGHVLSGSSHKPVLSSKVGRRLKTTEQTPSDIRHGFASSELKEPWFDYSYDGVMRSFEESLQRLQTSHINILLAHDLGRVTHGDKHEVTLQQFLQSGYRAMAQLKDEGCVDAIGVGVNEWQVCMEVFDHVDFDCVLLAGRYTLLDQSAAREFLPTCEQRNVSVISGGPFNSGILASGLNQHNGDQKNYYDYAPAPKPVVQRVREIEKVCREYSVSLPAAALQFPLGCPQVCSVLAGLADATQVSTAISLLDERIPAEFWQALKARNLLEASAILPGALT